MTSKPPVIRKYKLVRFGDLTATDEWTYLTYKGKEWYMFIRNQSEFVLAPTDGFFSQSINVPPNDIVAEILA